MSFTIDQLMGVLSLINIKVGELGKNKSFLEGLGSESTQNYLLLFQWVKRLINPWEGDLA